MEQKGHNDIVICDDFGTGEKWKNIAKRELLDIVHPDNLLSYIEDHKHNIKAIFHMGAISATTERDVDLIVRSNITLTKALWDFCTANNVRFIYASSAATYGDGDNGFDDFQDCDNLSTLRPLNAYGWSKHFIDRFIARAIANDKATPPQWAGLKFFNVYGPNEYHKDDMMSVICKLYPQIMAGEQAKLFQSHHPDYDHGGQLRDFIYVKDCVSVMMWLLDNDHVSGLFNVGTGQARSFKDLAEATFRAAGKEPDIEYIPMPEHLRDKYQYFTQANMDKLHKAGYDTPFTSLEDGITDYVQNYLANDEDGFV